MGKKGKMQELEEQQGRPLDEILRDAFGRYGSQRAVAAALGVTQPTISAWLARLGLTSKTVLIRSSAATKEAAPPQTRATRPEVPRKSTSPQL